MRSFSSCLILLNTLILSCLSFPLAQSDRQACLNGYGAADSNASSQTVTEITRRSTNASSLEGLDSRTIFEVTDLKNSGKKSQWITAKYLVGFFDKEHDTHLADAITRLGPNFELPVNEYYVKSELFQEPNFQTVKFQVACAASDPARPLTLGLLDDFFTQAPFWILQSPNYADAEYKSVIVKMSKETPDGRTIPLGQCAIDSFAPLDTWADDELLLNPGTVPNQLPDGNRPQQPLSAANVSALVRRDPDVGSGCGNFSSTFDERVYSRRYEFQFEPRTHPSRSPGLTSDYIDGFLHKVSATILASQISVFHTNYIIPSNKYSIEVPGALMFGVAVPKFYLHLFGASPSSPRFTLGLVQDVYTNLLRELEAAPEWGNGPWGSVDINISDSVGNGQSVKSAYGFMHVVYGTEHWTDEPVEMALLGHKLSL